MSRHDVITPLTVLAIVMLAVTGCARTVQTGGPTTTYLQTDDTASLDFWHGLAFQPAVTNDQALHGLVLLAHQRDPFYTYDLRVEHALREGWLPEGFDEAAELATSRGVIARALTRILRVEGGVMMMLTGDAPRYAHREMIDVGVMPPGADWQTMSGLDFVGVIANAQDYMDARGQVTTPALLR